MREKQLVAEGALSQMEKDLKATNKALDDAWASQNVDEIIRLEALKAQQEKAVTDKQSAIDDLRSEQEEIDRRNELARIGLEYEKIALEEIIKAMDRKIEDIDYENDLIKARNALIILALEKEKLAIDDAIYVLELQKEAIDNIVAAIELQMQARELAYRQSVAQYETELANERVLRAELELTKLQQEAALTALNLKFVGLMTASGAYTAAEALEVSKRLGLWSDQMQSMSAIITEFDNLVNATLNFTRALNAIPRDIQVTVTTNYVSTGTPPPAGTLPGLTQPPEPIGTPTQPPAMPGGMAHGGVVPGKWGEPIWVMAHGGERFLGINNTRPASTYNAGAMRVAPVQNNTYNTNYNVNASYSRTQSPASVGMDLRAMVGMTRR